ncbi:hypothetical protein VNO78_28600 [Psophocarpus tetragonolobus]|uniref:Uncharacterized protein n=1 Tax=Psophocarpus tetragonolobus TaxID=3891 RepID=A0AAN9X0L0_PSOTE
MLIHSPSCFVAYNCLKILDLDPSEVRNPFLGFSLYTCPQSFHDEVVKRWSLVFSGRIRDRHFLGREAKIASYLESDLSSYRFCEMQDALEPRLSPAEETQHETQ